MPIAEVEKIARSARRLDELISVEEPQPERRERGAGAAAETERVLDLWCQSFSLGDRQTWKGRLEWDGLSLERLGSSIARNLTAQNHRADRWTKQVHEVLAWTREPADCDDSVVAGSGENQGRFWLPFVRAARARLSDIAGEDLTQLSESAQNALLGHLVSTLAAVGADVLDDDVGTADLDCGQDSRDALIETLEAYPAFARQVIEVCQTWADVSAKMMRRLAHDRNRIEERLTDGEPLELIEGLIPGLSDRHHGGHQAMALRFSSGLEVVYKPRSVELEIAFGEFVKRLRELGLREFPSTLEVIGGEDYGWCRVIAQADFDDPTEVEDYYRGAGMLVCVAYILGASDLHMDNVIAGSHGPVLVDCETLLQPLIAATAAPRGRSRSDTSCLSTGLVTFPEVGAEGSVREIGGLCGPARSDAPSNDRSANQPKLRGTRCPPDEFFGEIKNGFVAAWRFFETHRDAVLAIGGPLSTFTGCRTRVVLRPSAMYAAVLDQMMTRKVQSRGWYSGILIDSLNRVFSCSKSRPALWPLAREERMSLESLDIPRFTFGVDELDPSLQGEERLTGAIESSGIDSARATIESLDEEGLDRQLRHLEKGLYRSSRSSSSRVSGSSAELPSLPDDRTAARILESAVRIGRRVASEVGGDADADRLGLGLYSGHAGVALSLAVVGSVSGDSQISVAARAAFKSIQSALAGRDLGKLAPEGSIGACSGLGGICYALAWGGFLLEDRDLVRDAVVAAREISPKLIRADDRLDVEGGSAGAIFGLLAVHSLVREQWLIERCHLVASRLNETRVEASGEGCGWPSRDGLRLAGFAHGASGIAAALLRLHRVDPKEDLVETALGAFRFERTLFAAEHENWWVPGATRKGSGRVFLRAWCHGAPGIALARMEALEWDEDGRLEAELDLALRTTLSAGLSGDHHLCCGTLGRTEILVNGSVKLGRSDLAASALERALALLGNGELERLSSATKAPVGLFTGSAGFAYQLVRIAFPHRVGSLLAFDPPGGSVA